MKVCLVFAGLLAILSASQAQEEEPEVATTAPSEENEDSGNSPSPLIDLYYPVIPPVRPPPGAPAPVGPKEPLRPPANFFNQFGQPSNRPLSPLFNNGFGGPQGQRQPFPGNGFNQQRQPQFFNRFPDYYK